MTPWDDVMAEYARGFLRAWCWHKWKARIRPGRWVPGWGMAYEIINFRCTKCGKVRAP